VAVFLVKKLVFCVIVDEWKKYWPWGSAFDIFDTVQASRWKP
jgi:hypothetical protein